MASVVSAMSPGYLSVNPYFHKDTDKKWEFPAPESEAVRDEKSSDFLEISREGADKSRSKVAGKSEQSDKPEKSEKTQSDPQVQAQVAELKRIESEVIAHEGAHMAVGGQFAGSATYSRTQGPDGRSYITGGEVSISVPASDDPNETIRNMEQVRAAALAPANPSSQDLSVAASASAQQAAAQAELAKEAKKGYEKSVSPNGLWTVGNGYEEGTESTARGREFSLAA